MKRIISIVLCFSIILSSFSISFAENRDSSPDVQEIENGFEYVDEYGNVIRLVGWTDENGFFQFKEYLNGKLSQVCSGEVGSGEYISVDYLDEYSNLELYDPIVTTVDASENIELISSYEQILPPRSTRAYSGLGTMIYSSGTINLNVYVSYENTYYSDSKYTFTRWQGTVIELTATLVSCMGFVGAIATTFVQNLIVSGLISVVGGMLSAPWSATVRAQISDETIKGVSTTDSSKVGYLTGEYVYVTQVGEFQNKLLSTGYTHLDWRSGGFGSAMFNKVYGVGYTPTNWIDLG